MANLDQFGTFSARKTRKTVVLSYDVTSRVLVATTLLVLSLGIFREWFIAHYGVETIFQDMRHIALDEEMCLGAWYSSMLMLTGAGLLFLISRLAARFEHRDVGYWTLLAFTFVGLSLDEATSVHEVFLEPIRAALDISGPLYFAWVVPALIMVPLFGLAYLGFLRRLPRLYGLWFTISGAVFIAGALGMEMVGGVTFLAYGEHGLPYVLSFITEESLETLGMTSFVIALVSYLRHIYDLDLSYHT
ncbi:MAG: hypothetical protein WA138_02860 [Parvibaculum sp.]